MYISVRGTGRRGGLEGAGEVERKLRGVHQLKVTLFANWGGSREEWGQDVGDGCRRGTTVNYNLEPSGLLT